MPKRKELTKRELAALVVKCILGRESLPDDEAIALEVRLLDEAMYILEVPFG